MTLSMPVLMAQTRGHGGSPSPVSRVWDGAGGARRVGLSGLSTEEVAGWLPGSLGLLLITYSLTPCPESGTRLINP